MLTKLQNIIFLLLFFFYFSATLAAKNIEKKNILLLHSYHSGMTWIENINKAVNDNLLSQSDNYVLYTEYMDTKRHNSKEYYEGLKKMYINKYKDIQFDLILSSDNNAFSFLINNRNDIFGKVPVSFCGVNGFEMKMLEGKELFTGVAEQFSDKETIDTILTLHPNIKNIYIINDFLATGKAWTKDMKKNLKEYSKRLHITYADNLTLKDLKQKVNSFNSDTIILLGVYFADKDKNYITYEKIGSYLLEGSKAPVYCLLNFNISNNVIGGKVIGGYSQGEAMSKVALRILEGEKPKNIPITFSEANEYVFNYNGIQNYNIDEKLLPKNSKLINKPFSLYEEYQTILVNLIFIFSFFFILFIILLIYFKYIYRSSQSQRDTFIISVIRFAPFFIIPIVTASIILLFIYSSNKNYEQLKVIEKETYIENMKQRSKREVDRYIQIVTSQTKALEDETELIKIRKNAIEMAQNIRYGKSGYIILGSLDGYMVSHPNKSLIGIDFLDPNYKRVGEVFALFKDKLDKQGRGFVEYRWENPSSKIIENKITYVNYLPSFNWYVASGVYLDEVDRFIESKVKSSAVFDERKINILIISSVFLLLFSFVISYILSTIIKNSFDKYRKNIYDEIEKVKSIEKAKEVVNIQKEEFERLFEHSPVAMAFATNDGVITKRNSKFIETFGYTAEDVPSIEHWYKVAYPDETYRKNIIAKWESEIKNAESNNGMISPIDVNISDKKGNIHNITITSMTFKNGILASFIDFTKQQQQEKIIYEQSKLASMGEMIGNIAHQWRQPLSVISSGSTGMLLQKKLNNLSDEQFEKTCNIMNDNAQYLSRTIDDFKNFIKNERQHTKFYLKENIERFITLVEPSVKRDNIKLLLNLDETIEMNGYPNELIQCYMNIFNNAKDALKESSNGDKYFFIEGYKNKSDLILKFKDNAGGIAQDILPRIFEPYFTTKHKSQGTGLGLHMTYNLVNQGMKGGISVKNVTYSYEGHSYQGAEFTITLPIV